MVIKKLFSKLPERMLSKLVLKGILRKSVDVSDETYQRDFKNFTFKVNWNICDAIGYQIYEQTKYTFKFGEVLDDAYSNTINILERYKTFDEYKDFIELDKAIDTVHEYIARLKYYT